jgi:hypothetical protein
MNDCSDPIKALENIINMFFTMIKNKYGLHLKDNVFNVDDLVMINFEKAMTETRCALTFCMDYTPSNGLVLIENSTVTSQESWKKLVSLIDDPNIDRYIFDTKIKSIENGLINLYR